MKPDKAAQVVHRLLGAYPTQRQRMERADIAAMLVTYTAGLADLDFELVYAAVDRLMRTAEWIPTIAAIRDAAGVLVHGVQRTGAEAWGSVTAAIGAKGSHRTPGVDFHFNDPITRRVVDALGWGNLCRSDNLTPDRARFIDAYEQIAKNERAEAKASAGLASKAFSPEDLPQSLATRPHSGMIAIGSAEERSVDLRDVILEVRANKPLGIGEFMESLIGDLAPAVD